MLDFIKIGPLVQTPPPRRGTKPQPRGRIGGKFGKMKETYGDIDGENLSVQFELNPITIKGPKLRGKFFGPVKNP